MELKQTPLYEEHQKNNAKLVPFAGFKMPIQYSTGIIKEHINVRKNAGLFDISHMGQILIHGIDSDQFVNYLITNNIKKIKANQAQYTTMCYENGTIVDDLIVYKFPGYYLLVVNASNIKKDYEHIMKHSNDSHFRVNIENQSDRYFMIALQGPKSETILSRYTKQQYGGLKYFHFKEEKISGHHFTVSRTGYTGEDGFEIMTKSPEGIVEIWKQLYQYGQEDGVSFCGLGARDSLRLEMGYPLFGNDIDDATTPIESNLSWVTDLNKEVNFVGQELLNKQKKEGLKRKLIAFEYPEKKIPRKDYPILNAEQKQIGFVTSGAFSPMLNKSIGMGYVFLKQYNQGEPVGIQIRNQFIPIQITKTPFYHPKRNMS